MPCRAGIGRPWWSDRKTPAPIGGSAQEVATVASRTITALTDDIDGCDADETITFAFNGTQYEIDLSNKNLD